MEVDQKRILDFFENDRLQFEIPPYQRIYSWMPRQCFELLLDIDRAARDKRDHFSGIMIFTKGEKDADGIERLEVVDGQQRLTTVTLLLEAFARYLEKLKDHKGLPTPEDIRRLLHVKDSTGSVKRKLILSREDDVAIANVLSDANANEIRSKHISANLEFFEERMAEEDFDPSALWNGLGRLTIIACFEDDPNHAQEIFESANSKGLPLTLTDLVRNYLLLEESLEEQERLYDEYWAEAADLFAPDPGSTKMNAAITAWISIRFRARKVGNSELVYSKFKRYVEDEYEGELETVLEELRAFCFMWREQYRYHAVKKFRSRPWAINGASTLTQRFQKKKADNPEQAESLWKKLDSIDEKW